MHTVLDRYGTMRDLLKALEVLVNEHGVKGEAPLTQKEKAFLEALKLLHNEFLKLANRIESTVNEQGEFTALFGRMEVLLGKVREPSLKRRKRL